MIHINLSIRLLLICVGYGMFVVSSASLLRRINTENSESMSGSLADVIIASAGTLIVIATSVYICFHDLDWLLDL